MQVSVQGHAVAIASGGKAFNPNQPTVLFIHGAGMDSAVWHFPTRALAHRGWNALAPDLPGHGRSVGPLLNSVEAMAEFVEALMAALGIRRAGVVGHSMGGAIALTLAARAGADALGLGLVGTAASIPVAPALLAMARDAPEAAYKFMVQGSYSKAAKIGGAPVPGLWMSGLGLAAFRINPRAALANDLAACQAWNGGPEAAARVACPTVVISAAEDVMTPAKRGVELAAMIQGARSVVVPRVGHMITTEAPSPLLDALLGTFDVKRSRVPKAS